MNIIALSLSVILLSPIVHYPAPPAQAQGNTEPNSVQMVEEAPPTTGDEVRITGQDRSEERRQFEERVRQRLNEQHQQVALRVAENMNRSNVRLASQYLRYLELREMVLGKIHSRALILQAEGKDITAVLAAIANTEEVIADVYARVQEQHDKEYIAPVTEAQTIGAALRTVVAELRGDHQALRQEHLARVRVAMQETFLALKDAASSTDTEQQGAGQDPNDPTSSDSEPGAAN